MTLIMENYSDQSKENQFKDWFCQQFNVDKDGKFKHQNVEFSFNKNLTWIMITSQHDDEMEVIFVDNDFCYIDEPYILLKLPSKRIVSMKSKSDQSKLDSMMAILDIMKTCEQYLLEYYIGNE